MLFDKRTSLVTCCCPGWMSRNLFIAKKIAVAKEEGTLPKSTHASSVVGIMYNARMITASKEILQSAALVHDIVEQDGLSKA